MEEQEEEGIKGRIGVESIMISLEGKKGGVSYVIEGGELPANQARKPIEW